MEEKAYSTGDPLQMRFLPKVVEWKSKIHVRFLFSLVTVEKRALEEIW